MHVWCVFETLSDSQYVSHEVEGKKVRTSDSHSRKKEEKRPVVSTQKVNHDTKKRKKKKGKN